MYHFSKYKSLSFVHRTFKKLYVTYSFIIFCKFNNFITVFLLALQMGTAIA